MTILINIKLKLNKPIDTVQRKNNSFVQIKLVLTTKFSGEKRLSKGEGGAASLSAPAAPSLGSTRYP